MRKIFVKILCCGLLVLSVFGAACGSCGGNDVTVGKLTPELAVSNKTINLVIGDEELVNASYNEIEGANLTFKSSDASVATVSNDGKITAVKCGSAVITVEYGGESVECSVSVGLGDEMPVLSFVQYYKDGITIAHDGYADVSVAALFNDKTFNDATAEYVFSDATVGKVENGKFTPLKTGETTMTVKATWRDITLESVTVNIKVISSYEIYVNDGSNPTFTLYTIESFYGRDFAVSENFVPHVKNGGTEVEPKIEIIEGADVISLENNVLTAKKKGTATVRVSAKNDETQYADYSVEVIVPVAVYSEKMRFSAADGVLPTDALFWENATITEAYQGTTKLTVEGNKVKGVVPNIIGDQTDSSVNPDSITVGETEITIYTDIAGIRLTNVTAYTKLIYTADDLRAFNLTSENDFVNSDGIIYGYFALGGNIEYDESWVPNSHGSLMYIDTAGFYGVFDGCGYSMHINMYGNGGLFGRIGRSCIKNMSVTFEEIRLNDKEAEANGFAYKIGNGNWSRRSVFSNVEINVKNLGAANNKGNYSAVFARSLESWFTMKNVVVNAEFSSTIDTKWGTKESGILFIGVKNDTRYLTNINFTDVYVISDKTDLPLFSIITTVTEEGIKKEVFTSADDAKKIDSITQEMTDDLVFTGIKRYENIETFKNAASENDDYEAFDAEYWTIENGTPVWKKKN